MLFLPLTRGAQLRHPMELTGRTSECECVPNVYLPPQRWQVAKKKNCYLSSIKCYDIRRHCSFTAILI